MRARKKSNDTNNIQTIIAVLNQKHDAITKKERFSSLNLKQ